MKNSIFKTFSKKMLRSEAFISVILVCVLAIGIIGTSYALYMDVDSDTDYQLFKVGDLAISFNNGDNTIDLKNVTPMEDDIAIKSNDNLFSFYIYNTGTYMADYSIKLVELEENEIDLSYINYQFCINNIENCKEIKTLKDINDSVIYSDELNAKKTNDATNPSVYYFLKIWVNNKYPKTESNKAIKLKVVIEAKNASGNLISTSTLSGALLNNENIPINGTETNFQDFNGNGMYKIKDDYGTSYYFSGDSDYNYVNFSNMCFRVLRIMGDGSTKLILENKDDICENGINNYIVNESNYGYIVENNIDLNNGLLKSLEKFKNEKLNENIEYLKEESWCYDSEYDNITSKKITSLNCNNNKFNSYVGLLTATESLLAGIGQESYLGSDFSYWTLSMSQNNESDNFAYLINDNKIEERNINEVSGIRPSIIIKDGVTITGGNGTKENPYKISQ